MELCTLDINQHTLTLSITGNFDAHGSRQAQMHIDNLINNDDHNDIEVDLAGVEFLDSSGIGAIVYLYKRLIERDRSMRIENVRGQPLEIISLLRINHAIPVNSKQF
ncbi:STAS domain-containing protein [Vibrio vulnificus]|nr:STAS domain-containing protein [Vibrio vulnificus]